MRSKVAGSMYTVPCATAVRLVSAFSLTSTIHARPSALKCVKSGSAMLCSLEKRLPRAQPCVDFANHIPYSAAFADALTRKGLERYTSRPDDLFARPWKMQVL